MIHIAYCMIFIHIAYCMILIHNKILHGENYFYLNIYIYFFFINTHQIRVYRGYSCIV